MATRQVTILERLPAPTGIAYRFALWLAVPAGRQALVANPLAASVIQGLTAAELTLLQQGQVQEVVADARWVAGTTVAQVEAFLQTAWTAAQAKLTADPTFDHYGSSWDGTTWTVVNNP